MKKIIGIFVDNVFIKLLALSLAVITYLYVHSEDITEKTIVAAAVRVTGLPSDWRVVRLSAETVDLQISGPREKIELRNRENVFVRLDMSNIDFAGKEGQFLKGFEITEEMVRGLDYDVRLVFPDKKIPRIEAEVALFTVKRLNVQLMVVGQPAPGFEERWRKHSPTIVDVTGPQSVIKYIDAIPTLPINISGRKESIDYSVGLDVGFMKDEKGVEFECDSTVQVSILIKPRPAEKKITEIPVRVLNAQDKGIIVKTVPGQIDVTVTGDVEELEKINRTLIKAYIDADDLPTAPGTGIRIGVSFFFIGEWSSLRIKDKVSVNADVSLK